MNLLVLAGGFGTRLQSAVPQVPKALAPIDDIPFLQLQIENWVHQGVTSLIFLLHHQSKRMVEFIKSTQNGDWQHLDIQWVIEAAPLGTGGAVANAVIELEIRDDFLLINADTWLGSGFAQLASAKAPNIGVIEVSKGARYGTVAFDAQNKVISFTEKDELAHTGWINSGLAHLSADLFQDGIIQAASLERDYIPRWVEQGLLKVTKLACDFIDIGIPEDYHRFCHWVASGRSEKL